MDIRTGVAAQADVFLAGLASQWMQQPLYSQSGVYGQSNGADKDGRGMSIINEEHKHLNNYGVVIGEHHGVDRAQVPHSEEGKKLKVNRNIGLGRDGNFEKKRRRQWGPDQKVEDKKRKSRWATELPKVNQWLSQNQLPNFVKELTRIYLDLDLQALYIKLLHLDQKLQTGMVLDPIGDGIRSPSPEPLYDNIGIRINMRESRAREKLTVERQEVIAMLIKKDPAFKIPADDKPLKHYKKLYIPVKEYPGYNFIGLIIGPRGSTQKQMEKDTGAKIVIRGKGSVKEGSFARKNRLNLKLDPSENEDLHVLVEADTKDAVEKAVVMVEKLLVPVEEGRNEHKRAQLRFLAMLNGTIRDDERCRHCGEHRHIQYACPIHRQSTFKSDVSCRTCGNGGHLTIDCPLKGFAHGNKLEDEYKNFLVELGEVGPDRISGASLVGNGGGGREVCSSRQSSTTLVSCKPQGLPPPQMQRTAPPSGPPVGGSHCMAYPPWIAFPSPMQKYNPYSPPLPGPKSNGPLPNSYFIPQGRDYQGAPSCHYGGPYNDYTCGPPPNVYAKNSITWDMPRS